MQRSLAPNSKTGLMMVNQTTEAVIGAAIEVHRHLGPGLLESAYEECLCLELKLRGILLKSQVALPISYKGAQLDCGYSLPDKMTER